MRVVSLAMILIGAGILVGLILGTGIEPVQEALIRIGYGSIPIVLFHAVPILLDVVAWRMLFSEAPPSLGILFGARWIGEAVNNLTPVPQIGGELARVRLAVIAGTPVPSATASVLADVTLGATTQVLFALAGGFALIVVYGTRTVLPALAVLLFFGAGIVVFYRLQRGGFLVDVWRRVLEFRLTPVWIAKLGEVEPFHRLLGAIYADHARVAQAGFWRLAGWIAGAGEIVLSLHFLGYPARWMDAFILESLSQAGRSAAFAVPAGLGAQEASFLGVGLLLGFDPATCIALALIRRGRDLALGMPALTIFGIIEARRSVESGQR